MPLYHTISMSENYLIYFDAISRLSLFDIIIGKPIMNSIKPDCIPLKVNLIKLHGENKGEVTSIDTGIIT